MLDIGAKLRAARKARKMSVRGLAQQTGFSASFLSQVELGQSSPSLASLQRICEALDVDLADLLRSSSKDHANPIVRRAERESLRSEWSKAWAESIAPTDDEDGFSAILLTLDRGGQTGPIPFRRWARALAYCIRGSVELSLGDVRYQLNNGDSVVIAGHDAAWTNRGRGRAEILLVSVRGG